MTFLKTFTTALVGLGFAAAAHAEGTFQAKFEYSKSAPASVTYASLENQSARACNRQASRSMPFAGPGNRYKWTRQCTDELLDKAVTAIGSPALMALHQQSAPPAVTNSQVAAAD
jgi:hypothetical protein